MTVFGILVCATISVATLAAERGRETPVHHLQVREQTGTFSSRTVYVTVDAFVVDDAGAFVKGLNAEDFLLFEDGQPREVEQLQLVDLSSGTTPRPAAAFAAFYYIVIDDLHVHPERTTLARQLAEQMVNDVVGPGDQAVVVFTSAREGVLQFTADRKRLLDAVRATAGKKLASAAVDSSLQLSSQEGQRLANALQAIETLSAVARHAASIPGRRKALVFLSEGADVSGDAGGRGEAQSAARDIERRAREVQALANRANVSIYAVDPRGVSGRLGEFAGANVSFQALSAEERQSQERLQELSAGTDGEAFVKTSNFDASLRRIRVDSSLYYLLAFRSGATKAGLHQIEVRVSRPGMKVRARKVFHDRLAVASPQPAAASQTAAPEPAAQPPAATETIPSPPLKPAAPSFEPAVTAVPAQPASSVDDLLTRAADWLVGYADQLTLVIGVERYSQFMGDESFSRAYRRMLVSEFALVRVRDDWLGFRDVYEVDGKPVADRQDRLRRLFVDSPGSATGQAREISDEAARHNLGAIQRNFNVPTMALFFLHPSNLGRFRFSRDGEEKVDGTPVWRVRYEETRSPTIITTSAGRDMPVKGTFWIDPVKGAVRKTHMAVSVETAMAGKRTRIPGDADTGSSVRRVQSSASITVTFKHDNHLDLLVPAEMRETYEGPAVNRFTGSEEISRVNCVATYSDFKRFQTGGRVIDRK